MDTLLQDFYSSIYGFTLDHGLNSTPSYQNQGFMNDFHHGHEDMNLNQTPLSTISDLPAESTPSSDGHPLDNTPIASVVLKYINEMLMEEEDLGEKPCMLQDSLALQAAEKSFYEALVDPNQLFTCVESRGVCGELRDSDSTDFSLTQTGLIDSIDTTFLVPDSCNKLLSSCVENYPTVYEPRGRKDHLREDCDCGEQGRSSKQSAIAIEDSEQSDIFDQVLLCKEENEDSLDSCLRLKFRQHKQAKGFKKNQDKEEFIDLLSLLILCAQAVSISDQTTASKLLKQIERHASPSGDGTQRLAHYFAKGLGIRLVGMGAPPYAPLISNRTSAADILKTFQAYVLACPFHKMSHFYANRTIMRVAEKATRLHIIDFGISYGFQWPSLIQRLSARSGGPPKLRITGIELPQPGFRLDERVKETGRRLKRYCDRFNVPFEFNVVAKRWETIKLDDLKIHDNELIVVNTMYRFRNLPDDTVSLTSARDTVLNMIKRINPSMFIMGVINGTYNAPFFCTRFREALFHYSAAMDVFEANAAREDHQRRMFEEEILGTDIVNVIACEGAERVQRPETYRQWQVRNQRAGLQQVGLDQELLRKVRNLVKSSYHTDFGVDVDGQWMLQGWKGRVMYALSCWKPLRNSHTLH